MKKHAMIIYLSEFLNDKLTERAIADDQDKTKIIRRALRTYLNILEDDDPMVDRRFKAVRDAQKIK